MHQIESVHLTEVGGGAEISNVVSDLILSKVPNQII